MAATDKKSKMGVRQITVTAMLSAVAFVLMYLEIPVPVIPSFIKFDFSDLPALLGAFALGPVYGVLIELVKNVLHLVVSQSMFIGELSNFILGATFTFTAGLVYKLNKNKRGAIVGGIVGALVMGIVSVPANYFVVYPVYVQAYFSGVEQVCVDMYSAISSGVFHAGEMKSLLQCLLVFNLPFTVVKGLISVLITMFIYKPLSPLLHGKN
ncbi:MAG: ECF transporter S component [Lachnospiraceae bacterium]|nr:ECF transporter S component [Lachnospiraceae bacterium]MBQ2089069.1 ECF transporter S component [Lachnospiraceae bacterium]